MQAYNNLYYSSKKIPFHVWFACFDVFHNNIRDKYLKAEEEVKGIQPGVKMSRKIVGERSIGWKPCVKASATTTEKEASFLQ